MTKTLYKECKSCWRIHNANIGCQVCNPRWPFKKRIDTWSQEEKQQIRSMLWSTFSHCEILENTFLEDVFFDAKGVTIHPVFDFIIPEYRLTIDCTTDMQLVPLDVSNLTIDKYLRDKFIECKNQNTRSVNYRRLCLSIGNIDKMRNDLIKYINEFYVLDGQHGVGLLTPKLQGDAGWDILCDENMICQPQGGTDIPSDLFLEIPNHLYAIVQARSSTSKKRLLVLPGVIDPGYRGRIYVMAYNLTNETVEIKKGDRIAQLLFFYRVPHLHMQQVHALRSSQRGGAGFGSTG